MAYATLRHRILWAIIRSEPFAAEVCATAHSTVQHHPFGSQGRKPWPSGVQRVQGGTSSSGACRRASGNSSYPITRLIPHIRSGYPGP